MLKKKSKVAIVIATIISTMIANNTLVTMKVYAQERKVIEKVSDEKIIDIPDPKFRQVINYALGEDRKSDAPIKKSEMESLKEINGDKAIPFLPMEQWLVKGIHDRGIKSIEGLQYAINLEKLDLSENEIKDLTPLKNLKKLTYIELDRNMLGDLTPLSNLTNLTHLNIYNNEAIVDMTPISKLEKLEWLDLHWCNRGKQTVNVEPLGKLINMKELNLESNLVSDISFTKSLKKLTLIGVGANNITDMSPLSNLIMKSYVDWDGTYVGMLVQSLKSPVNINIDYKESIYKIKDPVKGLDEYMKANDAIPEVQFLAGQENENVLLNYNKDTREIEVIVKENLGKEPRKIESNILLDYGFYSLGIKLNIKQDINSKVKDTNIEHKDKDIKNEKKNHENKKHENKKVTHNGKKDRKGNLKKGTSLGKGVNTSSNGIKKHINSFNKNGQAKYVSLNNVKSESVSKNVRSEDTVNKSKDLTNLEKEVKESIKPEKDNKQKVETSEKTIKKESESKEKTNKDESKSTVVSTTDKKNRMPIFFGIGLSTTLVAVLLFLNNKKKVSK
ncbi:leucine-rich repeat domain-containing protein [Hathewaya histolytica]|uniref:Copper amine oxidase family protein,Leucine Rich Repeat (LRR)-containing protein,Transglutaminase-like superfamily protein n=1 Tax=Hathewaya histolytica TaxID=1498 RepID=A0A4U9RDK7_HATHI|nr:leucine-rich repeat domain-containing protein [Hathewaya histolytica]VTQ89108.1 copper amine oxidase family protein,Leucine Rich Repeat (LRR)-containing protein,Transglutaminase-like superfamily protein [Hathewaya histolytica]